MSWKSGLEGLSSKWVGASPSLPLASIMTILSRVGLNTVRRIVPVVSHYLLSRGVRRNTHKVENVTTDLAGDHKSGRVADRNDRPCMVADAGIGPELRPARAARRCCGNPHGVALTESKVVFSRPAFLHSQDVNANLSYLFRKSRATGRGCPRPTLGLLLRTEGENICRGDHQRSCRLAGCVNWRRQVDPSDLEAYRSPPRTAKHRAVSSRRGCFESLAESLRGDPLHWSWASNATRVRQNVGDFVASDPGVGSDVVYENSMQLASLLKHVPGLVYQARGMLGSRPTLNDTGRIFTVRNFSMWSRVSPSNWRPGPKRVL